MRKFILLFALTFITSVAAFSQCQASFTYVVNGNTVSFTNTSSSDSSMASQWQWSFGDGNFSNFNDPQHTYAGPGTYQVCLFWVDFTNCPTAPTQQFCDSITIGNPTPCQASFTYMQNGSSFSFTNTSSSDSSQASQWQWSFGDGNFSNNNDPNHTYASPGTYQVCLFWVDFTNCPTTPTMQFCDSVTVPGANPCQASFTYTTNGLTVDFTNTSSSDSATSDQFQWSFGDGNFSGSTNPQHTFSAPGTYYVCLLVVDFNCNPNPTMQFCDSISVFNVGLKEQENEFKVKAYPNPIKDILYLQLENNTYSNLQLSFYNVLGKLIENKTINNLSDKTTVPINTSNWSSGAYFVSIADDEGNMIKQLKLFK